MPRKKVNLAFITNRVTRKATYKKRLKGLQKKVRELTVLCGIDACSIVYNPFNSQPEVWPCPLRVQQVIERFTSLPEFEQRRQMLDQESIVTQRISKLQEQLNKICKENRQMLMTELINLSFVDKSLLTKLVPQDMNDLKLIIDQKLMEIKRRIEAIKGRASDQHQVATAPALATALAAPPPGPAMPDIISEMLPSGGIQGQGQELIIPVKGVPGLFLQGGRLALFPRPS